MTPDGPRFGWYGDDFTGATDTLAVLAEAGLRTMLFMGVPEAAHLEAAGPLDAVGIAGASRAMSPARMAEELEPVGRFFARLDMPVLHYKCCSTFDSAPEIGSIGAAVAILRRHVDGAFVPIVGGQPSIGRYCAFSTLFAAAGAGGAVHRIDRHPTMSVHPVTPMTEADLRRHLAAQGLPTAGLHAPMLDLEEGHLDTAIDRLVAGGSGAVLFDVVDPRHLAPIGRVIWRHSRSRRILAVGPSSVAQALAPHLTRADDVAPPVAPLEPADGPVFVLAGSLSPVTRRQVAAATSFELVPIDADRLVGEGGYRTGLLDRLTDLLAAGRHTLAYTAAAGVPSDTRDASAIAAQTGALLRAVLERTALRRVGIAGGDTSSRGVQALGPWGLGYVTTLAPGVAICRARGDDPRLDGLEIMLKGGQMGPDELFERLVRGGC